MPAASGGSLQPGTSTYLEYSGNFLRGWLEANPYHSRGDKLAVVP